MEDQKTISMVEDEEKAEIKDIFKKLEGLKLVDSVMRSKGIHKERLIAQKVAKDLRETTNQYDKWWSKMAECYGWERQAGCFWKIDFLSNEIILISKSFEEDAG